VSPAVASSRPHPSAYPQPRSGQAWPDRAVTVRVPATSANLGPGFDALGLALTLHDEVTAEITGGGLSVKVSGVGEETAAAGERHLVVRAMRVAFETLGVQPPGIALRCVNAIPQGYGLGSSAGAIVAGLLAARALAGDGPREGEPGRDGTGPGDTGRDETGPDGAGSTDAARDEMGPDGTGSDGAGGGPLTDADLLRLASRMEGHPDNVAACLAGGLTIAWTAPDGARAARLAPVAGLTPVVCVPGSPLPTAEARQVLPPAVLHADAAANAARAALLIAALTADPSLLMAGTEDFLHQRYRAAAMPATADLIDRLRTGGVPAVVSGAGPSVLALTVPGTHPGPEAVQQIAAGARAPWQIHVLDVDRTGAAIDPPGAT
jgi:homoserine kinase